MIVRALTAAMLSLAFASSAHAADSVWERNATNARAALARSVSAHYLSPGLASEYSGVLAHARAVADHVPPGRTAVLANVLAEVARPRSPTAPRALELYSMLAENADYLQSHRLPGTGTDVTGMDGAVYRYFAGVGLEFHPLANAGALNALVAAGDTAGVHALVDALAARAVPEPGGALVWEYEFRSMGQRAPWMSGMAQAVLAQAFARAGDLGLARSAWLAIPGRLDLRLAAGPWIRLYSGRGEVVLNAQLQTAISLADYAQITGDSSAANYAAKLLATAKEMLPQFDTGHWSRYDLHVQSDLHYQDFVISLLGQLTKRTGDAVWQDTADKFAAYEKEPPVFTGTSATRDVFPIPRDGVRDDLVVRYFLSKPSKVALVVDGKAVDGYRLLGGWHSFSWSPAGLAPGTYPVKLVAADVDGNPGSADLGQFAVVRDTTPPVLAATKASGLVYWRAKDADSACCRIRIVIARNGARHALEPSRPRGRTALPAGYWSVTVVAVDAAGNRTERKLGLVVGHKAVASTR